MRIRATHLLLVCGVGTLTTCVEDADPTADLAPGETGETTAKDDDVGYRSFDTLESPATDDLDAGHDASLLPSPRAPEHDDDDVSALLTGYYPFHHGTEVEVTYRLVNGVPIAAGDIELDAAMLADTPGGDARSHGQRRFFNLWPNGVIPYAYDPAFDYRGGAAERAFANWETATSGLITFVPRNPALHPQYVLIKEKPGAVGSATATIGRASSGALSYLRAPDVYPPSEIRGIGMDGDWGRTIAWYADDDCLLGWGDCDYTVGQTTNLDYYIDNPDCWTDADCPGNSVCLISTHQCFCNEFYPCLSEQYCGEDSHCKYDGLEAPDWTFDDSPARIVGMAGAKDSDTIHYVWYQDSAGTLWRAYGPREDPGANGKATVLSTGGYAASEIVAMGIRKTNSHVFTYFDDGMYCEGYSRKLCYYNGPDPFTWAAGYSPSDIIDVAFHISDRAYVWYRDGMRGYGPVGAPSDLGAIGTLKEVGFRATAGSTLLTHEVGHLIGLPHEHQRYDRDEYVYITWDNVQEGEEDNFYIWDWTYPPPPKTGIPMGPYDVISVMHYRSDEFSKNDGWTVQSHIPEYQDSCDPGVLSAEICPSSSPTFGDVDGVYELYYLGTAVGKAIMKSDGHTRTWYRDERVTEGTAHDPAVYWAYGAVYNFLFGTGTYGPGDVTAVAVAGDDDVYVWYDDAWRTWGNVIWQDPAMRKTVTYPAGGYGPQDVVGIGIAPPNDHVHTYFANGMHCAGTTRNLCSRQPEPGVPTPFTPNAGYSAADIREVAFKPGGEIVVWYTDGAVYEGYGTNYENFQASGHLTPPW